MSDACNTAAALAREHFHGPEARPAQSACATQSVSGAAACAQAAAVLDLVEDMAAGSAGEAATQARNGAAWAVQRRNDAYWGPLLREGLRTETLRPEGAFGQGLLATPCGLEAGPDGLLRVSSLGGGRVSVFTPRGEIVRHAELPGSRPWGLFPAVVGGFWVCDFAQARLTRLDADDRPACDLHLEADGLRPILGAADPGSGALFLILADATGRNRRLARLEPPKETGGSARPELLPCPAAIPSALRVRGNALFVSSQNPATIFSRPPASGGRWTRFNAGPLPEYLTQFAFAGADAGTAARAWIAAKGRIARLDAQGRVERVVDAATLAAHPGSNFCGLAELALADGLRLFVADNINNLIHAFRLD